MPRGCPGPGHPTPARLFLRCRDGPSGGSGPVRSGPVPPSPVPPPSLPPARCRCRPRPLSPRLSAAPARPRAPRPADRGRSRFPQRRCRGHMTSAHMTSAAHVRGAGLRGGQSAPRGWPGPAPLPRARGTGPPAGRGQGCRSGNGGVPARGALSPGGHGGRVGRTGGHRRGSVAISGDGRARRLWLGTTGLHRAQRQHQAGCAWSACGPERPGSPAASATRGVSSRPPWH